MKFWKPKQVLHSKHRSVWPSPISRPGGHMTFSARTLDKESTPFPHHCTPLGSSCPEPLLFLLPRTRAPFSTQANGRVSLNRCSRLGLSRPPACGWKLHSPSHGGRGAPSEESCCETSRPSFSSCPLRNNDKLTGCGKSSTRSPFSQLHAASAPDRDPHPGSSPSPRATEAAARPPPPISTKGCKRLAPANATAGPGPVRCTRLPRRVCSVLRAPPPRSAQDPPPLGSAPCPCPPPPDPITEGDCRTHGLPAPISMAPRPRLCRTPAQPTSASGGAEGTTLLCAYASRRAHGRWMTTRCPRTSPRGLQGWNEGGPALVCVLLLCTCSRSSPREKNLIPNPTPVPVGTVQHGFRREPRCSPVRRRGMTSSCLRRCRSPGRPHPDCACVAHGPGLGCGGSADPGSGMAGWVFCNRCFQPPHRTSCFRLTNCGHVYCDVCLGKGEGGRGPRAGQAGPPVGPASTHLGRGDSTIAGGWPWGPREAGGVRWSSRPQEARWPWGPREAGRARWSSQPRGCGTRCPFRRQRKPG